MRKHCILAALAALLVVTCGAQAQTDPFFRMGDGLYGYAVSNDDRIAGLWGVANDDPEIWVELMSANDWLQERYDRLYPENTATALRKFSLIYPGDVLRVPEHLVEKLRPVLAPETLPIVEPALVTPEPVVAQSGFPWQLLLAIVGAILLLWWWSARRQRLSFQTQRDELLTSHARSEGERAAEIVRQENEQRELHDPYAGPPVVEGGIPTVEAARNYFAEQYQSDRRGMTVGESEGLPERVTIDRIDPVWVKGEMGVRERGKSTPVRKVLKQREPAWRATLSDGSSRITLWKCGNDVTAGNGFDILPETQIEERTDVPSYVPDTPVQVWPVVTETPEPELPEEPAPIPTFTSVKATGPKRYVLHSGTDQEKVIDLSILAGITLGIDDGEIFLRIGDERRTIGHLVEEAKASPAKPVPADAHEETPVS